MTDKTLIRWRQKALTDGTRQSAIRAMCVHCMGGSVQEIPHCTASKSCPLWPWRNGNRTEAKSLIGQLLKQEEE